MKLDLAVFYHPIEDIIAYPPEARTSAVATNAGEPEEYRLKLGGRWKASRSLSLCGYYAHQTNERAETDDDVAMPRNQIRLRANRRPAPKWRVHALLSWVADRQREATNPLPPPRRLYLGGSLRVGCARSSLNRRSDGEQHLRPTRRRGRWRAERLESRSART